MPNTEMEELQKKIDNLAEIFAEISSRLMAIENKINSQNENSIGSIDFTDILDESLRKDKEREARKNQKMIPFCIHIMRRPENQNLKKTKYCSSHI